MVAQAVEGINLFKIAGRVIDTISVKEKSLVFARDHCLYFLSRYDA